MAKKRSSAKTVVNNAPTRKAKLTKLAGKQATVLIAAQSDYASILTGLTHLIADSRRRAAATVNRELVCLYWQIGQVIVEQQASANWGDSVVEQLANDLQIAFPDMKGLTKENLFRMRKFFAATHAIDEWLGSRNQVEKVATVSPQISSDPPAEPIVATVSPQLPKNPDGGEILSTLSRGLKSDLLATLLCSVSWSHHKEIIGAAADATERYFYMTMSARERWSVRELRRQIDAALFERYTSVKHNPEKCLPTDAESGDLMPFKDHYILEFLGLEDEHSEKELRKAILANMRDFFLEFGKDLTFVGEEYPLTVGNDKFYIDLLFFHRRLQCLIAVDLKKGKFKPEHAGKSRFYCAALDEQLRLPHENPSLGLVLCRTADATQVRLALTAAAERIGIATYQTALPDEALLRRRLEQLPPLPEDEE
ncbi:MAG TPA: PDDEXK nuclease domain-containing protein [Planctomycetaceae bacterium]|nr:PDDEXK nuclease domain-containing protein [Planctomycetaceae bacterium]